MTDTPNQTSPTAGPTLADRFVNFLFDLDGVIYVGDRPVPGAPETIAGLRRAGKGVLFLTNDPRSSAPEYARKLTRLGVPTEPDGVLTAGAATARYLQAHFPLQGRGAFVIGTPELKEEFARVGLQILEGDAGLQAGFVIVGSYEGLTYRELTIAALAVRRGARFFAPNRDATFPMPEGLWPSTGAILAAVEVASGRTAIAVGKPEPLMLEIARARLPAGGRTAIVGDRADSDILGGQRAGIGTILVLTGATSRADLPTITPRPDYVIEDIRGILLAPGD